MTTAVVEQLDHVVLAVRDLEAAVDRFTSLGFDVLPGGRHEDFGTRNATVPLGGAYLELLTVEDEQRAAAAGRLGNTLLDVLRLVDGALVGFAVAASSLDGAREALRNDPDLLGPFELRRPDADGRTLRWRLLIPGGTPWRRPWPMLIEWDEGDARRAGGRASHPNGVRRLLALTLELQDVEAASSWYARALGLTVDGGGEIGLGDVVLKLRPHRDDGPLGPGPSEICLAVDDLERVTAALGTADTRREAGDVVLAPEAACGAVLCFREARG